jgi:hypothetical protein
MTSGNKSILEHLEDGRALRLFSGARGTVRYEGEFQLDEDAPWYTMDAPETDTDETRSVMRSGCARRTRARSRRSPSSTQWRPRPARRRSRWRSNGPRRRL